MDTNTKHAFRSVGPYTVSTGWREGGSQATVEVVIRRDRLGPGDHAEDIQLELARLITAALEKRYNRTP
ncbi:MAG: hypothetical protein HUU15_01915 [Candidatus Brocadiae bacterium]|nr:hypothetical protein [Candidatus Brocadiia bacterium]